MSDRLLTAAFRLAAHFPLAILHNLGALLGWVTWLASASYRRKFRRQIEIAGLQEHTRAAIGETGKMMLETPRLWLRPHQDVTSLVAKVTGWDHVEAAMRAGKGILFLTPHLGCFEIAAQYYALHGPITVLYRRSKYAWLEALIQSGRGRCMQLAPADLSGVRRLLRALRSGEAVGLLPDQVPGNGEGVWAPFFGQPAYTMTLAARLADTGASAIFTYAERLPYGAGYDLHFLPPAQFDGETIEARTAHLNREVEAVIRRCPQQYLWGYNRYKAPKGVARPC